MRQSSKPRAADDLCGTFRRPPRPRRRSRNQPMSRFSACTGCVSSPKTCDIARAMTAALRGFNISFVRHKCFGRAPLYRPGDAVLIRTRAWQNAGQTAIPYEERESEPPWCDFAGRYLEQNGRMAICFIAPKTVDTSNRFEFEPSNRGFVKVPFSRVKANPSVPQIDVALCDRCGEYYGLTGFCDDKNEGWNHNRLCARAAAGDGHG